MANGQPVIQGGANIASLPTGLAATTMTGSNRTAFSAFGSRAGAGLFGTAPALGPNLLGADTGVIGAAPTTGVFGVADGGIVDDGNGNIVIASAGVAGLARSGGVGVHGNSTGGFGVLGQDNAGIGVQGKSAAGPGVAGDSVGAPGVRGRSGAAIGVLGEAQASQGVFGRAVSGIGTAGVSTSGTGVHGKSTGGIGVVGQSTESIGVYGSGHGQPGVRGDSDASYGVLGMSTAGNGVHGWSTQGVAGVSGYNPNQRGLQGTSISGYGLWAECATNIAAAGVQTGGNARGGAGVLGMAQVGVGVAALSASSVSLYAKAGTSLAARFDGDVEVRGGFRVIGGPKSAVVPHKDGTHRQLYCVESPESWFEDFGEARLAGGSAKVALEAEFAALVQTSNYQVFLTPYDDVALYVKRRSAQGFEVGVVGDSDAKGGRTARFGYRVVAKRSDIKAPRLAKVRIAAAAPEIAWPQAPKKGKPPVAPKAPKLALGEPKAGAAPALPPAPVRPDLKALMSLADGENGGPSDAGDGKR